MHWARPMDQWEDAAFEGGKSHKHSIFVNVNFILDINVLHKIMQNTEKHAIFVSLIFS